MERIRQTLLNSFALSEEEWSIHILTIQKIKTVVKHTVTKIEAKRVITVSLWLRTHYYHPSILRKRVPGQGKVSSNHFNWAPYSHSIPRNWDSNKRVFFVKRKSHFNLDGVPQRRELPLLLWQLHISPVNEPHDNTLKKKQKQN